MNTIISLENIQKSYGAFDALHGVNLDVRAGEVLCVLGDNGAGKSTLIKILAGLHQPSGGVMRIDGNEVILDSPRAALDLGIATVYQNLAVVGQMSVWRNFFLGQELTGPLGRLRSAEMREITAQALKDMGINLPNVDVEIDALSGGQRQVVAIARAMHFGARVLILDEPTAALGVKQSGMVLKMVATARKRGVAVVLITHNPHHAYLIGDHFTVLGLGRQILDAPRAEIALEELTRQMAGGGQLEALSHELER
ncbi:ATP-binding cassette domain-containing protein [Corynebacterium kozikiae]|uniref:ATP-binding cassette domain-containing protein n=1 Tax=Corynebacterium kozikiae TaxID=2968469 RepID=UPI00211C5C2C|nr:ATP-binding cassette domain-containing protein [Corynebacterium sp. 76QC2CO]MCQ9344053.1 ATP-binding cassette domain-containing protein [Corynebacterium sp. 76QC2CO]